MAEGCNLGPALRSAPGHGPDAGHLRRAHRLPSQPTCPSPAASPQPCSCRYAGYACEDQPKDHDGWFVRTQAEWERDTGLTRREQETARRLLRERGLLEERRVGMPAVLWYRVNWARLRESLERQSRKNWAGRLGE
jgi:hypothetical protein